MRHQTLYTRKRDKIRELNDRFRQTFAFGEVVCTQGIYRLPSWTKVNIFEAVRTFNRFDEDNDPYGEHDFGIVTVDGAKCYWKIDYYDQYLHSGSKDASDPHKTRRVLTIMLAEEY